MSRVRALSEHDVGCARELDGRVYELYRHLEHSCPTTMSETAGWRSAIGGSSCAGIRQAEADVRRAADRSSNAYLAVAVLGAAVCVASLVLGRATALWWVWAPAAIAAWAARATREQAWLLDLYRRQPESACRAGVRRAMAGQQWRELPAQWMTYGVCTEVGLLQRAVGLLPDTELAYVSAAGLLSGGFDGTITELGAAVTGITAGPRTRAERVTPQRRPAP